MNAESDSSVAELIASSPSPGAPTNGEHEMPLPEERLGMGRKQRSHAARSVHSKWEPPKDRADPVALLEASNKTRIQELVPIRYGRMLASPFTYLRGSPIVMANDLATTPSTGFQVQLCGDCHLMNFGLYASPERNLLFDINDFDETLPGPWEWDVKRLVVSFVVAARARSFRDREGKEAAWMCAQSYREHMREYSRMSLLDVWYSRVDADAALRVFDRAARKPLAEQIDKAWHRNRMQALSKLTVLEDEKLKIATFPPLIQRLERPDLHELLRRLFRGYLASLQEDRRTLVERYRYLDFALKVVGVGSVGTRCYIVLLDAGHNADSLLLQVKEADASILEPFAGKSSYHNHGHRVVAGQRLMQSASDMFLGWSNEGDCDCYFRQLRDMKGSADLEAMSANDLIEYAELCGWVLARAHARSGDAARIAGYLGKAETFDDAAADFAMAYADQNDRDYETLHAAARSGRIAVETGV